MSKLKKNDWQRLIALLNADRKDILQVIYYAIFAGLVNLSLPLGIQAIINLLQGAQITTSWIVLIILVTLGVAFVGLLQLTQLRIIENLQQKIFTRSSFDFAYRFPKIRMEFLRAYYPPELANRFFDTVMVQKGVSKMLLEIPAALMQILFGLLLLSFYHPFFILYGVLLVGLVYLVFRFTLSRGITTSLVESAQKYKVAHWLQEIARSVLSFKMSGRTSLAMKKNDGLVMDYLTARENHFKVLVMQYSYMIGFKVLVTLGLLLIGGILVLNQEMNIGQFVAAEIIIILVISSVEKLIIGLETFYDLITSLEKIGEVSDQPLESALGQRPDFPEGMRLQLNDISLKVDDRERPILKNLDLQIAPGDRILLRGPSGSGKSTLLKVLAGIFQPTGGDILVNGIPLKAISLKHYRSRVGQCLPEESPFEGTLKENLTFDDPEISEQAIREVIQVVGLEEFLQDQAMGLDAILYPEGQKIPSSVGRKVVLARSILRVPGLMVLEDPMDQLGEEEGLRLMDYLAAPERPWALIVVSSYDTWKQRCNRIIHLDEGTIVKSKEDA